MGRKKLGNHEVIKRNYEYILLAQKHGFFTDGYIKSDIATCNDWVIVWWIDEIRDLKKDKEKFVSEILPNFKRWFSNGIRSTGVGMLYDSLKMAEQQGIKIDSGAFDCIGTLLPADMYFNHDYSTALGRAAYFENKEILENLKRFHANGVPICYELGSNYDALMELERKGENIDRDVFTFLATTTYESPSVALKLYADKKELEAKHNYYTCNAGEVKRLNAWKTGYNNSFVFDVECAIEKCEKIIARAGGSKLDVENLSKFIGKKVSVRHARRIEANKTVTTWGILESVSEDGIILSWVEPEMNEKMKMTISGKRDYVIISISCEGRVVYSSSTHEYELQIAKYQRMIERIESRDILSEYEKKYGTIAGLAYLREDAWSFVDNVDKAYPIDNLFACCFKNLCWLSDKKEALEYALYAHDAIISGEMDEFGIKDTNMGYPIDQFLADETIPIVEAACQYVLYAHLKKKLTGQRKKTIGTHPAMKPKEEK